MKEPEISFTFSLVGIAVAFLGPIVGPFALLIFSAAIGSLLAMSKEGEMTRLAGLRFIAIGFGLSMVLTGVAMWMVEKYTPIPPNLAFMPVAFTIAATRTAILSAMERLANIVVDAIAAMFARGPKP